MDITCPHCNTPNRSTAQFCDQCGKPLHIEKKEQPKPSESPAGNAFNGSSGWETPSSSSDESSAVDNDRRKGRPPNLPEHEKIQHHPRPQPPKVPQSASVKPGGVAFESSGGGSRDGRPISLPEQQGGAISETQAPKFSARGNRVIGEVRDFRERRETEGQYTWTIWNFRVERYDDSGNQMQPVPVEIKGMKFEGAVSEGDWVELPGDWKPGEVASPKKFTNLTTGAEITGSVPVGTKIGMTCGWIIFIVFIAVVIAAIYFIFFT